MTSGVTRVWQRLAVGLAVLASMLAVSIPAEAHGFGQRFDLPLPLWLWVTGAGASIVLSFVVTAIFVRETPGTGYPSINLLRYPLWRVLAGPVVVALFRMAGVFVFLLTVVAGFWGAQDSYNNLIVTMIWVIWWVGVAFLCALVGNFWRLINPLSTIYGALQWLARRATGWPLTLRLPYPRRLGKWPAFLFYLAFAWLELASSVSDIPLAMARATLNYSIVTFIGMFLFGRRTWLENGEAFTIAFGVLQRFAPLHMSEKGQGKRRLELRPYGAGLMDFSGVTVSLYGFVLLMLSTVTFDGFLETPLFRDLATSVYRYPAIDRILFMISDYGPTERQSLMTILLVLFPLAFMLIFWLTSMIMAVITRRFGYPEGGAPAIGGGRAALAFVLTLVPIAVAYHLAHYFTFLFTTGQYIIPLMSDPFGSGADYLGTAGYKVNLTLLSPYFYWYASVVIIIVGHVIAVYLAHVVAFKLFVTRRAALISQIPMVLLMVLYTSLSLWILAQPIVE